jgi:uncharacterized alkaline shock family protein YloU
VHISNEVVAVIAAHHARGVPGVAGLRPRIGRTVTNLLRARTGSAEDADTRGDGVVIDHNDGDSVTLQIDIAVQLGRSCPEVGRHVQEEVATGLEGSAGLKSLVSVNIVDVTGEPEVEMPTGPVATEQA